jgi:hypothetical protein
MARDDLDDWIENALRADPLPIMEVDDSQAVQGPPLTESEIISAKNNLSKWQAPADFVAATKSLCVRCKSEHWFNDPKLKILHDAYVLAEFVRLMEFKSVRLGNQFEQWPDGFVKSSNMIHNIEVTSTHGGRKLGKEYRTVSPPTLDPVSDWVARADSIPKYLDECIQGKVKKKYSSPYWLVVYLNISEYGIRQKETEEEIAEIKTRYANSVSALSILWKGRIY